MGTRKKSSRQVRRNEVKVGSLWYSVETICPGEWIIRVKQKSPVKRFTEEDIKTLIMETFVFEEIKEDMEEE